MIKSLLNLVRWQNLIIVIFTQYLIRMLFIGPANLPILQDYKFTLLVISTVLITAAGNIFNDVMDLKTDLINKPEKVYINRVISSERALQIYWLFNIVALFLGSLIHVNIIFVQAIAISLLFAYSTIFKKKLLIGNLVVAFLTALVVIIIEVLYQSGNTWLYVYAFFAFAVNLIREIIKDLEDLEGDRATGAKTLPVVIGISDTKIVLKVIIILFIIILTFFIHRGQQIEFVVFIGLLSLLLSILFFKVSKANAKDHFTKLSQYCKFVIIFGLLSLILFKIPVLL